MPARRYYIATIPVDHINGKMAPVRIKVSNVPAGVTPPETSFWYGYRLQSSPNVSRYGIRTEHRMLEDKPYTPAEEENRTLFTLALNAVNLHREIAGDWELCKESWKEQDEYKTLNGFAVAVTRANEGIWPEQWTT